jgi:hypothetical protein
VTLLIGRSRARANAASSILFQLARMKSTSCSVHGPYLTWNEVTRGARKRSRSEKRRDMTRHEEEGAIGVHRTASRDPHDGSPRLCNELGRRERYAATLREVNPSPAELDEIRLTVKFSAGIEAERSGTASSSIQPSSFFSLLDHLVGASKQVGR